MVLDIVVGKLLDERFEKSGKKEEVKNHFDEKRRKLQEQYGKRCPDCDELIEKRYLYCPNCGKKL